MAPQITRIIATLCPDVFCLPTVRAKLKSTLSAAVTAGDGNALAKGMAVAQPFPSNLISLEQLEKENSFDFPGPKSPIEEHTLVLDRPDEPIEPIYFALLDELLAREGWGVEKLIDTVSTTLGSGLSTDLQRRMATSHQEVGKVMSQMHSGVRNLLNRWKKWRDQKGLLALYDQASEADESTRQTALARLREKWRKEKEQGDWPGTLNQGDSEFAIWLVSSGDELRKTMEMERQILASDLNLLKLQAHWIRPYLQPQNESPKPGDPSLITGFNTALFEIVLLVTPLSDLELAVQAGRLPKVLLKSKYRRSWPMVTVSFRFRLVPERSNRGGYGYHGRVDITFTSFALNQEERNAFRRELQRSEWGEVSGILEQSTTANLRALLADLDEILPEKQTATSTEGPKQSEDTNPFLALFSFEDFFGFNRKDENRLDLPRSDNDFEKAIRSFAILEARRCCLELYEEQKRKWQLPVMGE